jgi:hypothetical protein
MVLIALVAFVAIGGLISTIPSDTPSAKPSHVSTGQCETGAGVSLVVDFGSSSNKEVSEFCVKDFDASGWDIFAAAGVEVEGTAEYPTGFVCRISGWPSKQVQPCTKTPTAAQGSWGYFVAEPNDSDWKFSGQGAANRTPSCGAVEGWRFIEPGESASQSAPRVKPATFKCK